MREMAPYSTQDLTSTGPRPRQLQDSQATASVAASPRSSAQKTELVTYLVCRKDNRDTSIGEACSLLMPYGDIAKVEIMDEATKDFRGMTARPVIVVCELFDPRWDAVQSTSNQKSGVLCVLPYNPEEVDEIRALGTDAGTSMHAEQYRKDLRSVFLGNLPSYATDRWIVSVMNAYDVVGVQMKQNVLRNGKYIYFAYVEFLSETDAQLASIGMNEKNIEGVRLRCDRKKFRMPPGHQKPAVPGLASQLPSSPIMHSQTQRQDHAASSISTLPLRTPAGPANQAHTPPAPPRRPYQQSAAYHQGRRVAYGGPRGMTGNFGPGPLPNGPVMSQESVESLRQAPTTGVNGPNTGLPTTGRELTAPYSNSPTNERNPPVVFQNTTLPRSFPLRQPRQPPSRDSLTHRFQPSTANSAHQGNLISDINRLRSHSVHPGSSVVPSHPRFQTPGAHQNQAAVNQGNHLDPRSNRYQTLPPQGTHLSNSFQRQGCPAVHNSPFQNSLVPYTHQAHSSAPYGNSQRTSDHRSDHGSFTVSHVNRVPKPTVLPPGFSLAQLEANKMLVRVDLAGLVMPGPNGEAPVAEQLATMSLDNNAAATAPQSQVGVEATISDNIVASEAVHPAESAIVASQAEPELHVNQAAASGSVNQVTVSASVNEPNVESAVSTQLVNESAVIDTQVDEATNHNEATLTTSVAGNDAVVHTEPIVNQTGTAPPSDEADIEFVRSGSAPAPSESPFTQPEPSEAVTPQNNETNVEPTTPVNRRMPASPTSSDESPEVSAAPVGPHPLAALNYYLHVQSGRAISTPADLTCDRLRFYAAQRRAREAASMNAGYTQAEGVDASAPPDQRFVAVPVTNYQGQYGQAYYAAYANPGLQMQTYVPVAVPSHGMTSVAYMPNGMYGFTNEMPMGQGMVMQNGMPYGYQLQNLPAGYQHQHQHYAGAFAGPQGEENDWFQQ
ncbi:hypothetical protein B0T10DRAFT_610487 [Thelonectria olida]|uniref:RRM domain-containing protein n=1 Tax=Thelonectria olida TaxID=1576542 RepID=A0A9P8VTQ7_9HYPO|nr:hypothetical protein B0T10DRAFT_610487 [Thelonectria olida]